MDELYIIEMTDGEVSIDALPNGDVYVTLNTFTGGSDICMSPPEAIEFVQAVLEMIKYSNNKGNQ